MEPIPEPATPMTPTPPHRLVGRALVVGLVAGLVVMPVLAAFLFAGRAAGLTIDGRNLWVLIGNEWEAAGIVGAGSALGVAVILAASGLTLRVRPRWRPLALLGTGAATGLLIALATACVEVGPDPERLVQRSNVVRWWRDHPDQGAADLVVVAVVALGVGLPRVLPWRGAAPPWPRRARVGAALAAGPVCWLAAWLLGRYGPGVLLEPWPFWDLPGAFLAAAAGVALGLEAGEAADDRLVGWWRARVDRRARLG